jgi:hypothetical protein
VKAISSRREYAVYRAGRSSEKKEDLPKRP